MMQSTTFDIQVDGKQMAQDDMEAADREGLQRVEALGSAINPHDRHT